MKKILALILCIALCMTALAGCGGNKDDKADKASKILTIGIEHDIDNYKLNGYLFYIFYFYLKYSYINNPFISL